jgi:hypothetical protein
MKAILRVAEIMHVSWPKPKQPCRGPRALAETAAAWRALHRRKPMSETNRDIAVTFYKAVIDGRIEDAFRLYAGTPYLQHNPLIEDGTEGLRKVATWLTDAHCEIILARPVR